MASALSQIGALGNKDEYSIAIGAACRARHVALPQATASANIKELGVVYNYALSSCVGPAAAALQGVAGNACRHADGGHLHLAIRVQQANQLAEALRLMRFIDLSEMARG